MSIRGQQIRLLESQTWGAALAALDLTVENVVSCFYHALLVIRRSALDSQVEYESIVAKLIQNNTSTVGLQIRTGRIDREQEAQQNEPTTVGRTLTLDSQHALALIPQMHFFHCAQDLSDSLRIGSQRDEPRRILWYLITDDLDISTAASERWGTASNVRREQCKTAPRLLTLRTPSLLGHTSHGGPGTQLLFFRHSLVEQVLFSLAEYHIISPQSGFRSITSGAGSQRTQGVHP